MSAPFAAADQAVRDEIVAAVGATLTVEAGAGTGKTSVLVRRLVEVLRSGQATVDEVAVMTFTDAAAAELSARVREELEEALGTAHPESEEARRLDAAVSGLYRARIETIHAFATSLLRERPIEARLDPGFEVLEGIAGELDFDDAYADWLERVLSRDDALIARALNRGIGLEHLYEVAKTIQRFRYVLPLAPLAEYPGALRAFVARLADAVAELDTLLADCDKPDADKGVCQIPQIRDLHARLVGEPDEEERERIVLYRIRKLKRLGARPNWSDYVSLDRMKQIFVELNEAADRVRAELRAEALAGLAPLASEFVERYAEERRAAGQANFDDLLIWARDLLRDSLDVRRYFQRRYRAVLVDEFQDTDPIQAQICLLLASDGQDATALEELEPAPGKLFVVGDPKQSIYRFRRADIALYDELKRGTLAPGLRTIFQNFRCLPGIIDFANAVFDEVLVEEPGLQPGNVELAARPATLDLARSPVVVLHGDGAAEKSAAALRAEEAELIARTLRRAIEIEQWPVRDRRTGEARPARYRDVAILVPARTELDLYEDALETAGVPYRHEGARTFFKAREVIELISILRAIDDPTDKLSLVAALRSRAFGCSDEELFVYSAAHRFEIRRPQGVPGPVRDALEVLGELHRARRGLSLPELVRRVLERTGIVEFSLAGLGGREAAANLLKVVDQARTFAGAGGLRGFTRWLSERRDQEADEADAGVAEESDDVVRMLTIHASKGLEFPIVCLANLQSEGSRAKGSFPERVRHRLHLRVGTERIGVFKTPGYDDAAQREEEQRVAERKRLLYVAVTRARDHLVIPMAPARDEAAGMLAWLAPQLPQWRDEYAATDVAGVHVYDRALLEEEPGTPPPAPTVTDEEVEAAMSAAEHWEEERDDALAEAGREVVMTVASSVQPIDVVRPLVASSDGGEGDLVPAESGPPLPIGHALHRALETVTLPGAEELAAVVRAACREAGVEQHWDDVLAMAQRCLASAVMRRAVHARFEREVPVTAAAGELAFAVGRMDLVFEEDGGLVIVDYKSDLVNANAVEPAALRHRGQAAVYAWATQQAAGLPVKEVVFVFGRPGGEWSFPVDEALLAEGELLAQRGETLPPDVEQPQAIAIGT